METLRADAVVIGSGAGGAPAAATLAEAGLDVVLVEAGPHLRTQDFSGDEGEMTARLMTARRAEDSGLEIYAGRCVGGSTVVNDALCWRPPPEILQAWREDHGLSSLTEEAFAPHVDRVWQDVHAEPTRRSHLNRNAYRLELGAGRLGWQGEAMPRNVRGCARLGLCNVGCPTGAKQSTLVSYVPRALRAGAKLLASTRVERVSIVDGRLRGVEAVRIDPESGRPGGALEIQAPLVLVAAGVLETPALLLRSGLEGATGVGLQFHSSVYVTARFEDEIHGYYGPTMGYAVTEFSDVHGHRGPGFMIEHVTVSPITTALALPGFGSDHERAMAALPYLARAVVVLRDRTRGRLALDADGRITLTYDPVPEDLERLRQGMQAIARAYLEAGAREVWLPVNGLPPVESGRDLEALSQGSLTRSALSLLYAVHLFGGAAMASSPERGVVDERGAVFGVEGLYVSDAASLPTNLGANPQVTIMANSLRIVQGLLAEAGAA